MGLNEVEDFTLEAKLVAIKTEVKIAILDFLFFKQVSLFSSKKSSSEVSESKEKHDSRSEDEIKFEVSMAPSEEQVGELNSDSVSFND